MRNKIRIILHDIEEKYMLKKVKYNIIQKRKIQYNTALHYKRMILNVLIMFRLLTRDTIFI